MSSRASKLLQMARDKYVDGEIAPEVHGEIEPEEIDKGTYTFFNIIHAFFSPSRNDSSTYLILTRKSLVRFQSVEVWTQKFIT